MAACPRKEGKPMSTVHEAPVIPVDATPACWLEGFTNEDGSPMSRDQFDDMWENRTSPDELAKQVARGEWGLLLQAQYALSVHTAETCTLLLPPLSSSP